MEGQKVICPNCKEVRHQTTKFYDPNQTPKGHFLELIEPWKHWKWNTYDDEVENISGVPASLMCCPGCAAPLVTKNRLTVVQEPEIEDDKLTCECGKKCKSLAGLMAHQRVHKK